MIALQDRAAAVATYRALNESSMQRRLRAEKRCYIGAVDWHPSQDEGDARTVWLTVHDHAYNAGEYGLEGTSIDTTGTIAVDLPARSAVCYRFKVE